MYASVHFERPVRDPARPDSIGRTDFAAPEYSFELQGSMLVITHGTVRLAYPVSRVVYAVLAAPLKGVANGRR